MVIARWILLLLGLAAIVSFALYIATGQDRFRRHGVTIIKWVVASGLVFFGWLVFERLALS
jgi:D-alanyl-lipoteichoic acid acyltransferase DltB (MBOAT superfamily)